MIASPWASLSLWFCSIGDFVGLRLVLLVSFSLSDTYFYWDMKIPCRGWATSKPRKYFNLASAFISNSLIKHFLKASLPSKSSPITKMSLIGSWLPLRLEFKISAEIGMTQLSCIRLGHARYWPIIESKSKSTKMMNFGTKVRSLGLSLHFHPLDLSFCILVWLIYL